MGLQDALLGRSSHERCAPTRSRDHQSRSSNLCTVDSGPMEELGGQLMGLLIRLGDRVDRQTQDYVHEFVDHNEHGLALETLAEALGDGKTAVSESERSELLDLASRMQVTEFVLTALARCPRGG